MLRTPVTVVFAAGLLLTLGVGSAFAHSNIGPDGTGVARPATGTADCGQQLDQQGDQQTDNSDALCDDVAGGSMDQQDTKSTDGTADPQAATSGPASTDQNGQSGENTVDQAGQTGTTEADQSGQTGDTGQTGQTGDNQGDHQD